MPELLLKNYGVKYSPKQVWIITREKLGLNYRKPYLIYNKAPDNAEKIFMEKTSIIDLKNENLAIEDESRAQIQIIQLDVSVLQ